ncbi:MAG: hypothetical protein J3R72DRAFT_441284 [Linnemannia gamsii]|nr:MAG: hypothetical protein J3R72DRAFT_441284 [Linnemannia gamsii]
MLHSRPKKYRPMPSFVAIIVACLAPLDSLLLYFCPRTRFSRSQEEMKARRGGDEIWQTRKERKGLGYCFA